MGDPHIFQVRGRIVFGPDCHRKIGEEIKGLRVKRVLIVTDELIKGRCHKI